MLLFYFKFKSINHDNNYVGIQTKATKFKNNNIMILNCWDEQAQIL